MEQQKNVAVPEKALLSVAAVGYKLSHEQNEATRWERVHAKVVSGFTGRPLTSNLWAMLTCLSHLRARRASKQAPHEHHRAGFKAHAHVLQPRQGLCTMIGRSLDPHATGRSHQWSDIADSDQRFAQAA